MTDNRSYRRRKVSHHRTWTAAKAKLARLVAAAGPDVFYDLIVNQDTPHMPHEVWIIDYRRTS